MVLLSIAASTSIAIQIRRESLLLSLIAPPIYRMVTPNLDSAMVMLPYRPRSDPIRPRDMRSGRSIRATAAKRTSSTYWSQASTLIEAA